MTASRRPPMIGVCGAGSCDEAIARLAREVGRRIAEKGGVLVCGGLGGVMAAAADGARSAGGTTIGLLPGDDPEAANPFIQFAVATGLGHLRNALIVRSARAIIALPGGPGTLSEIALGLKMGKTVVGLTAWGDVAGIRFAETPEHAIDLAWFSITE